MLRRSFFAFMMTVICVGPALAASTTPLQTIESTVASGRPVLVHITATWCGICERQKPLVSALLGKPEFKGLTKLDVDFDSERDVLAHYRVQSQSTMLLFKNGKEIGRQVGETDPKVIAAFLRKAM